MANLFTYSITPPTSPTVGMAWIQPASGQIYLYLNGDWQLWTGGKVPSYKYPFSVFINGKDRSDNIDQDSFGKTDALTNSVDTCSFTLFDYNNNIKPIEGEEIIVYYKLTEIAEAEKIFSGRLSTVRQSATAPGQISFNYDVGCVDYSADLKNTLVVEIYEDMFAGDIIKNIIQNYAPSFICNEVQDGQKISYISFNYESIKDCIMELASLTGYDWYVDYDKDIHFFSNETNPSPYLLTENIDTTAHYKNLEIMVDKSQLRNKIYVRGGVYLSDLYTQERIADGTQLSFNLDYNPRAPILVYVNIGAGYVLHSCGIDNINTTGFDFVVNYNEKVIKNLDHAVLTAGNKIKITYTYECDILTEDNDIESQGINGICEYLITDITIQTIQSAHDRATAELERYSTLAISGSFITDQHGYRSGQILTLQMTGRGYAGTTFLIDKVKYSLQNSGKFEYTISFSRPLVKSLERFLIDMLNAGRQIIVRENETIHELYKPTGETISLADAIAVIREVTPPFRYDDVDSIYGEAEYA